MADPKSDLEIYLPLIAGVIGGIIASIVKFVFDKLTTKRIAKNTLRPEIYEKLIHSILAKEPKTEELDHLKIQLLVFAKDDVIKAFAALSKSVNGTYSTEDLYRLLVEIRSNLGMDSNFSVEDVAVLLNRK